MIPGAETSAEDFAAFFAEMHDIASKDLQSVPRRDPDEDRDIIEDTIDKTAFVRSHYPQWGDPE
jgi:hypothetical protein